jgi:hypothetical protein
VADELYAALCDYVHRRALVVAENTVEPSAPASIRYLSEESRRFVVAYPGGRRLRPSGAPADALDVVLDGWEELRAGRVSGEGLFAGHPRLWPRLMEEWPMGQYAEMVAETLAACAPSPATVVELGAGVGATTRRIRRHLLAKRGRLLATDKAYTGSSSIDFDSPLSDQLGFAPDVVVATNALHCARDPQRALVGIAELLRPGGLVVLGEGAPFPEPGIPWALNLVFGPCHGWHDRGGFREAGYWTEGLRRAGFEDVTFEPCSSQRYDFGGVFTGCVA